MCIVILSQKVRWFGGKGIDFHPWGQRINFHKWHGLWVFVSSLNIPYVFRLLSRLGGISNNLNVYSNLGNDTCQQLMSWN
jgi:hypothetical protein